MGQIYSAAQKCVVETGPTNQMLYMMIDNLPRMFVKARDCKGSLQSLMPIQVAADHNIPLVIFPLASTPHSLSVPLVLAAVGHPRGGPPGNLQARVRESNHRCGYLACLTSKFESATNRLFQLGTSINGTTLSDTAKKWLDCWQHLCDLIINYQEFGDKSGLPRLMAVA